MTKLISARTGAPLVLAILIGCDGADGPEVGSEASQTASSTDQETEAATATSAPPPRLDSIAPPLGDPLGGLYVTLSGSHLLGSGVEIGGLPCADVEGLDAATLRCRAPALPVGSHDVVVRSESGSAALTAAYEAWSPARIEGARLFDARVGVETAEAKTLYEWQRLTAEISPEWRVRDGNTLSWLPSTGRYWMVGGWNGLQEPEGFSHVDPALGTYPLQNTTDEVWSTTDGISWTLELPHEHGQFERRHVHNTVVWQEALWVIGGDTHQGYYNHDVLSSADGLRWEEVLAPGEPPWAPRALQISGVYAGALWTGGGQDLLGDEANYTYHNDLWRSEDGITWSQIASDAPASATRWGGCGMVDGFVEFAGRMWLVGCARYREVAGHELVAEVWSTADGVTWRRHADPPWAGKGWPNVLVWDNKLWILFGYTYGDPGGGWPAGNANEAWFSADGERWEALPVDYPAPGSHAQGVAARGDELLYAGGNYSFGFGAGYDKSAWRLVPFRGLAVEGWTDRGGEGLRVAAPNDGARPVLVADAFGQGEPGLQFDGSRSVLALGGVDSQPAGRTVLWVARAPYLPLPWGWEETYAPVATMVGGLDESGYPNSSLGYSGWDLVMVNREAGTGPSGEPLWARIEGGRAISDAAGAARLVGLSHGVDGTVTAWVDGARADASGAASYNSPRSWSRIGGSMEGDYYGVNSRFSGTVGAVLILPQVLDEATAARIHTWARGRFGVP